jgi:hypothetical protein
MTEITLKTETAQFDALKAEVQKRVEQVNLIKITDDTTLAIANQQLSLLSGTMKDVVELHKITKEPFLKPCQQLDKLKNALYDPMKTALDEGKLKIQAYDKKRKEEALAEQNRILAIKNAIAKYSNDAIAEMDKCATMDELRVTRERLVVNAPMDKWGEFQADFIQTRNTLNEYAKSLKTKLENPTQSDPEEQVAIKEAIVADNASIGQAEVAATIVPKLSGTRKTWTFEVIDFNQIPRDWLELSEDMVKKFIAENKETLVDGQITKGIKYFQKESLTIR